MPVIVIILAASLIMILWLARKKKPEQKTTLYSIPAHWTEILSNKVDFYRKLSPERKMKFDQRVAHFLATTQIIGIETDIDDVDRLLVASGAIIPVFEFPHWEYFYLDEVILYPDLFDPEFKTEGRDRLISGMVGRGVMEGKMILSKKSLHLGFDNTTDKKNVAIHEFIHLIDKQDGVIDGIPSILLGKEYALPWIELMRKKINDIQKDQSDINPYGGTSVIEFFAVSAEYFFERPKLFRKKHPDLYQMLEDIFLPKSQI